MILLMAKDRNVAVQSQRETIVVDYVARDAGVGAGFVVTAAGIAAVTSTTCAARKSPTAPTALHQLA